MDMLLTNPVTFFFTDICMTESVIKGSKGEKDSAVIF